VNATQKGCCALCAADPFCVAWAWQGAGTAGGYCQPLAATGGTKPSAGRVIGGVSGGSFGVEVAYTAPGGGAASWSPARVAAPDAGNLNGTYRALDCYTTPMQCADDYATRMGAGLISTSGFAAVYDTGVGRFVPAPALPAGLDTWWSLDGLAPLDAYFMTFPDLDFRGALAAWAGVLGAPAMLPRSALGNWWSRYYDYTATTIVTQVLQGYADYAIPLNNLVFDMDWHAEPADPTCSRYGNWDVNRTNFPDMAAFAADIHAHGSVTGWPLKLALNVHPETGVDHCDSRYADFARALGVDPATNATIKCDMGNQTFADTLARLYMDAEPLAGVDVWWTDYAGCGVSGNNPQLWSNQLMHQHAERARGVRGQAFSRYGGLGNHRFPHGFSGDTFQHEVALYWQVKTTQTAANVLWGYWSHDIGGNHAGTNQGAPGTGDPANATGAELLLRWIQWGAVSPVLRTHCDHCERRIWLYPYFEHMRDALRLRSALVPYLYTESRAFFDSAVAPVHPLYYDAPGDARAYAPTVIEREFMFGDAVLASPITTMIGDAAEDATIAWSTYLPAGSGSWSDWNGTALYEAGATVSARYGLGDVPLFARAGALVPLATMADVVGDFPSLLVWVLFPGAPAGAYSLYEDNGDALAYAGGDFVTTAAAAAAAPGRVTLTIAAAAAAGALPAGFPAARAHALQVRGAAARGPPRAVTANGDNVPQGAGVPGWAFVTDANHSLAAPAGSLVVTAAPSSAWQETVIDVQW
jgi:alpha-glucosidase (family GH31 glycosyl hydrolase)